MSSRPDAGRGDCDPGRGARARSGGTGAANARDATEATPNVRGSPMRMDDLIGNVDLEREENRAAMLDDVREFGGRDDDEPGTLSPAVRAEMDEAFGYDRPAEYSREELDRMYAEWLDDSARNDAAADVG